MNSCCGGQSNFALRGSRDATLPTPCRGTWHPQLVGSWRENSRWPTMSTLPYSSRESLGNGRKPISPPPQPGCWMVAPLSPHEVRRTLPKLIARCPSARANDRHGARERGTTTSSFSCSLTKKPARSFLIPILRRRPSTEPCVLREARRSGCRRARSTAHRVSDHRQAAPPAFGQ